MIPRTFLWSLGFPDSTDRERNADSHSPTVSSVSILDSIFIDVTTVVLVNPITATPDHGSIGIDLENVALSGVSVAVVDTTGATLLASSSVIDQWAIGPVYEGSSNARSFSQGGKIGNYRRHSTILDAQGNYFERARPQYEDQDVSALVHTKDLGCAGDGFTDDTAAFQTALYASGQDPFCRHWDVYPDLYHYYSFRCQDCRGDVVAIGCIGIIFRR